MNNRERIISGALQLFNEKGVRWVSVRDICHMLDISPGNFSYHFPSKEKVIEELYDRMTVELHGLASLIPEDDYGVKYFLEAHRQVSLIQIRYKFFFLNFFEILTNYSEVKTKYLSRYSMEREYSTLLLKSYIKEGVLLDELATPDIERIIGLGYVLNNFWLIDAEIHGKKEPEELMLYYLDLCCGRLLPYLSDEAKKEYHDYFEQLQKSNPASR